MRLLDIAATPFWEKPYRQAGPGGEIQAATLPFLHAFVDTLPPDVEALLVCSDLQGREPMHPAEPSSPLLGEALLTDLTLLAESGEIPDLRHCGVLLLGDFYADPDLRARGVHGDVGAVWRSFADHGRWVVGVAGNHDLIDRPPVADRPNTFLLDGDTRDIDGLRLGGVSGIIGAVKEGRVWRRSEAAFIHVMQTVLRADPDILLLHQGPDAATAEGPGHPAIRATLEAAPPTLTLCGHVHWSVPLATLSNGGQVLNVDGRLVVLQALPGRLSQS